MKVPRSLPKRVTAVTILFLATSLTMAGKSDNDGKSYQGDHGTGWNPTIRCHVEPEDTLDELMDCLADGITHPPQPPCFPSTPSVPDATSGDPNFPVDIQQVFGDGSDDGCADPHSPPGYTVTRWRPTPPHYGLEILRDDGREIDRLYVWENDPAMQMTYVEVLKHGLAGRIAGFVERPSKTGGQVIVTVNGFQFTVDTSLFNQAEELTANLLQKLKDARFEARRFNRAIIIELDPTGASITTLRFQSTDPGVISSNIGVAPLEELLVIDFDLF